MHDPAVPDERPPYWAKCERMSVSELDRFIRDAAGRVSDQSAPDDGNTPRTPEEFADLCALMRAKVDALKRDTTMPDPPDEYDGPPSPGPFSPSDELEALYRWLEADDERLDEEREYGRSGTYVEYLEQEVEKRRAQIAPIERRERQKHDERVGEYETAREPYRRLLQRWRAEVAEVVRRRETNARLEEFVKRAYRRSDWAFKSKRDPDTRAPITRDFEIASPGEQSDEHVRAYYREVVGRGRLGGCSRRTVSRRCSPFPGAAGRRARPVSTATSPSCSTTRSGSSWRARSRATPSTCSIPARTACWRWTSADSGSRAR
jgi:hypothetical protein